MSLSTLIEFLDSNHVKYVTISHSPAYTAQEIAACAHVKGKELAKTVVVKIDGKFALAVLPATRQLDFDTLQHTAGAKTVELATEDEFKGMFPGCDPGAMPPFGSLFEMKVYVCASLSEDEEIAFNAGSHTELIKMSYKDFENLANPTIVPEPHMVI